MNEFTRNQAKNANRNPENYNENGTSEDYSCFLLLKDRKTNNTIKK